MIDEALINGIRKNEETAFIKLYELYAKKIYKTAYMMTNDKGAAQDIVQEVFIKIFIRIDDLKNNFAFNSWLYRITVNCCLNCRQFFY
jgi:RNA polymerase sigma-70 factor (ECF subfamily)